MRFRGKNEKGEPVELPVRVRTADDHKEIYAHGAMGGFFFNYHYRLDFYRDDFPPIKNVTMINNELVPDSVTEVNRTILASLYLSPVFAKELRNWLDKNIAKMEAQYGEIALPASDKDEEDNDAVAKIKKEA